MHDLELFVLGKVYFYLLCFSIYWSIFSLSLFFYPILAITLMSNDLFTRWCLLCAQQLLTKVSVYTPWF